MQGEISRAVFCTNVLQTDEKYATIKTMNTVRLNAYAKLNLTLDVTGRDGEYHTIDSLVCTIDLYDRIVLKKRKDFLAGITMHGMGSETIQPERNNAVRAAEAFISRFHTAGAEITVYKNIPIGAGLGGSSADAAGVLVGMAKLYGITDMPALKEIADSIGSDTGYMLKGGLARMCGRGTELEVLPVNPRFSFLLLCPQTGVSAGQCYSAYDALGETHTPCTERAIGFMRSGNIRAFGKSLKNDLYPAAASLCGEVKTALQEAESFSPLGAAMTGSGSAVFALFETRELCEWAKSRYRGKFRAYTAETVNVKRKNVRNPFVLTDEEKNLI